MPNGRSRGRRRGRRPKRRSNEKGGRTVQTAAPALFAFMGSLSSSVGLSAWRWACAVPRCGSRCFRNGQRKAIIRTHRLSETGSDYIGLQRTVKIDIFVFGVKGSTAYKTGQSYWMPVSCAGLIFSSGKSFRHHTLSLSIKYETTSTYCFKKDLRNMRFPA